jgi:hypothetical protein
MVFSRLLLFACAEVLKIDRSGNCELFALKVSAVL